VLIEMVNLSTAHKKPPFSGTVFTSDPLRYGFGEKKNLIIINISLIGGVDKIHDDDKKHASLEYYENGFKMFNTSIGIELKGRGFDQHRYKLNYAFEFQACEDTADTELECSEWGGVDLDDLVPKDASGEFGAMGNFEDYVLRGEDGDPSFTRGDIGAALGPIPYNTKLVELVFMVNHQYTYEGVYILQPNIKKRDAYYHENNYALNATGWGSSGKMPKCKASNVDPSGTTDQQVTQYEEQGGLVFEYSLHGSPRDTYCVVSEEPHTIEMGYPKCSKINTKDECRTARRRWVAQYSKMTDATSLPIDVHVEAFADTMLLELVLLRLDFGFSSVFFQVPPGSKQPLLPGPIYDCDGGSWRYRDHKSIVMTMNRNTMPLYKTLLADPSMNEVLRLESASTLERYKTVIDGILDTRIRQESLGYFEGNTARWPFYGEYHVPPFEKWEYAFPNGITKPTMREELAFVKQWFDERIEYLRMALPTTQSIPVVQTFVFPSRLVALFIWIGTVLLLTIVYLYTLYRSKKPNTPSYNKVAKPILSSYTSYTPYTPPMTQLKVATG